MFGKAYFGPHYFGAHWFGPTASVTVDDAIEPLVHGSAVHGYLGRGTPTGVTSKPDVTHGSVGRGFLRRGVGAGTATARRRVQ